MPQQRFQNIERCLEKEPEVWRQRLFWIATWNYYQRDSSGLNDYASSINCQLNATIIRHFSARIRLRIDAMWAKINLWLPMPAWLTPACHCLLIGCHLPSNERDERCEVLCRIIGQGEGQKDPASWCQEEKGDAFCYACECIHSVGL
ncbi:hypothetical protein H0G86_002679 [Trichoderma simmonsii]|uniref:Uncharacterized protein n=1 Tax=Trichoderma simmonsii TaxID=1491479 RepID=A0A8G0PCE9_9HYPO|nr:hypothetical protein H0G86_002679 [Trichoderma simmonsii]